MPFHDLVSSREEQRRNDDKLSVNRFVQIKLQLYTSVFLRYQIARENYSSLLVLSLV